ncbi:MAG: hypothetical protein KF857_13020 [Fimbriimonadaceae bacterium]|nr:hypothetical protein [Fimbriimonadaceae bacterium]
MAAQTPFDLFQARMRSIDKRRLLKPMRDSEVVDVATRVYQNLAGPMLRQSLVPMAFCYAAIVQVYAFVLPLIFQTKTDQLAGQVGEVVVGLTVALLVSLPLFVLGVGYTMAVCGRLAADFVMGDPPDEKAAASLAMKSTPSMMRLMGDITLRAAGPVLAGVAFMTVSAVMGQRAGDEAALLSGFLAVIAFLCSLVAVPWALYSYALAPTAMVFEGVKGKAARQRSRLLMKSYPFHGAAGSSLLIVWLIIFLVGVSLFAGFSILVSLVAATPFYQGLSFSGTGGQLMKTMIEMLPAFFTCWLAVPLYATTTTVLYFDRRVRIEAFDIRTLAEDIKNADRSTILLS